MGILSFFLDAKKVIMVFAGIGVWTILLDLKSVFYFLDLITIGVVFWFCLSFCVTAVK